jgi:hypothetical protein
VSTTEPDEVLFQLASGNSPQPPTQADNENLFAFIEASSKTQSWAQSNNLVDNPLAFLDQNQDEPSQSPISSDEPILPITVRAQYATWTKRHKCDVRIHPTGLTVVRDDGTIVATVPQTDASRCLRFFLHRLKLTLPGTPKLAVTFEPSERLPMAIGRAKAWAAGLTGNGARAVIHSSAARFVLAFPLAICLVQLLAGGMFVLIALQNRDKHMLVAAGIGVPALFLALCGMVAKKTWGPLLAAILNVLAIGDTLLIIFTLPHGHQLTGFGIGFVFFRCAVLASFARVQWCGYEKLQSVSRFALRK